MWYLWTDGTISEEHQPEALAFMTEDDLYDHLEWEYEKEMERREDMKWSA